MKLISLKAADANGKNDERRNKKRRSASKIIRTFHQAIYRKNPKIVYRIHNSLKMKLLNALPPRLQDWILAKFF
jgi:hypothetical protein